MKPTIAVEAAGDLGRKGPSEGRVTMHESRVRTVWRWLGPGSDVSILDLMLGLLLSAWGVALVSGAIASPGRHGGVAAAVAILTMTLPVVWRRRYPVIIAVVLFGGAVVNALAIGTMVRCGPALPALFLSAYALGRREDVRDRRLIALGLAALVGSAAVQCFSDPNLQAGVIVALAPMIIGLCAIGRLVSSQSRKVARLTERHAELRRRRVETARLAAQADRARIAEGLDDVLRSRLVEISDAAEAGRDAVRADAASAATQQAFVAIETTGRETLRQMRQVVGTLLDSEPPKRPQPDLGQLEDLVSRSPLGGAVSLNFAGPRRSLPAGLELSAYRTIEHLLDAFVARRGEQVLITVSFGTDQLTLAVRGPAPAVVDQQAAITASKARVAVHNGGLSTSYPEGQWEAIARLPLPAYV